MESEGFKPEGPVANVLFLPELLEKILTFCSYSDQQSLLNSRLVCTVWRDCAYSVLQNNPSILASIHVGERNSTLNSNHADEDTQLRRFCETFTPPGFLPLRVNLKMAGSDSLYPQFFTDFSQNIVCIELDTSVFDDILRLTNYPNLRKITLAGSIEGFERVQDYFLTPSSSLTELILEGGTNIQLGTITKLEVLRLRSDAYLSKTVSVSDLLPNLREISFGEQYDEIRENIVVDNFSSNGARFEKGVNFQIHEALEADDFDPVRFKNTVNCFPNLRKLDWTSAKGMSERIPPIQIVFSTLRNLTSLRLMLENGTASEIFALLTNLSVNYIPVNEAEWNVLIVNITNTILNLKNLRTFNLEHKDYDYYYPATRIPELQSRFLLKAVFLKMENLQKILFGHIRFNSECIQIWRESGREFETIGLDDEEEDQSEEGEDENDDEDEENDDN